MMFGQTKSEWTGLIVFLVAVGSVLGVGALKGCDYVRAHVEVRWVK